MKTLLTGALLFTLATTVQAAMPPNCPMHQKTANVSSVQRVAVKPSFEVQMGKALLGALVPARLYAAVTDNQKPSGDACPHQQWVKNWRAWRHRNPNAPSKWDDGSQHIELTDRRLSFSPDPDEPDPEPDPGLGGCGCDLATALAAGGCGWWHAEVWAIKSHVTILAARK